MSELRQFLIGSGLAILGSVVLIKLANHSRRAVVVTEDGSLLAGKSPVFGLGRARDILCFVLVNAVGGALTMIDSPGWSEWWDLGALGGALWGIFYIVISSPPRRRDIGPWGPRPNGD